MNSEAVRMEMLKKAAWQIAYRFQAKVYLVGSYIQKKDMAHDIDLVLVLTNEGYDRLFGVGEGETRNDCLDKLLSFRIKQKRYVETYIRDMDIDFTVKREGHFFDGNNKGDRICIADGIL